MVARGHEASMNGDGCNIPILPPNSMMAAMGVNRGPQMLFAAQNSPPQQQQPPQQSPGEFPLQGAFDLTNNGPASNSNSAQSAAALKRKELFNQRKQREFIPDNKKDDSYWDRRRRNNEAAKRSREKRRFNDMVLEQRVIELTKETHILKAQLIAIKDKFGINGEGLISLEQVLATLPSNDQVLSLTKRTSKVYSEFGKSSEYSDDDTRDTMDHHEQMYMQQHGEERSRSPDVHHHLGQLQRHVGMPPHIDIGKPNNDQRPMFKYCGEDCSPISQTSSSSSNGNRRSNSRSSLSPSNDILNLSITNNNNNATTNGNNNHGHSEVMNHNNQNDREHKSFNETLAAKNSRKHKVNFVEPAGDKLVKDKVSNDSMIKAHINVIVNGTGNNTTNCAPVNNSTNNNNNGASNLPHKLRHKMSSHMGEKEVLPFPFNMKRDAQVSPPIAHWDHDESTNSGSGSSDERDSGISINGEGSDKGLNHRQPSPLSSFKVPSPTADNNKSHEVVPTSVDTDTNSPGSSTTTASSSPSSAMSSIVPRKRARKRVLEESVLETENSQLKTEMARLAAEVACLKNFLTKKPNGESNDENSCDSSH